MMTPNRKVALVTPPLLEDIGHHPLFPPLGLAYLAAVLDQNGFEVKIIDCPVNHFDYAKLKTELAAFQPSIIGIGSMTPVAEASYQSARVAREACPEAQIIMGGPHATFQGREILETEKAVDLIVRGEGEETLLELAKRPETNKKLADIQSITFRNGNEIVETPTRPFIADLDALPRPAYKFLPIEKYWVQGQKLLSVITSRGCPYACPFCVASQMFGQRFRARSAKNVLDELQWLKEEYGAEGVAFQDDTLTFDKKRAMDICDGMIERKLNLRWGCGTRADVVTKDLLERMAKANCDEVMFGIESGCESMRATLKRGVTNEHIENAIKWAKEAGMFVTVSVILGYPGETRESLQETLDFVRKIEPDDAWLCHATPFPGTHLREIVEQNSWKMSDDWKTYNTMNAIFEDPNLPAKEIALMRKKFYDKFYTAGYIMRQAKNGYIKGNMYSKIMTRTAANYILWRVMSAFHR
jgi:anaerobic magnesium-protoporphyrin IX monomethyl ester cyclase